MSYYMSDDAKPLYLEKDVWHSCDIHEINGEVIIYGEAKIYDN